MALNPDSEESFSLRGRTFCEDFTWSKGAIGNPAYEIISTLVVRDDYFSKIIITAVSLRILKKYSSPKIIARGFGPRHLNFSEYKFPNALFNASKTGSNAPLTMHFMRLTVANHHQVKRVSCFQTSENLLIISGAIG